MKLAKLASIAALVIIAEPATVDAQALPEFLYFVENNTDKAQRCNFRLNSGQWEGWFTLTPGEEFSSFSNNPGESARLFCTGQSRSAPYRLRTGQRYTILRKQNGKLQVRRIHPDVE